MEDTNGRTLPNFIYPGGYRMDAHAAQARLEEIKSKIILALPPDVWRRVKDTCNTEQRYGLAETEQSFLAEALTNHLDADFEGYTVRELADIFRRERAVFVAEYGDVGAEAERL